MNVCANLQLIFFFRSLAVLNNTLQRCYLHWWMPLALNFPHQGIITFSLLSSGRCASQKKHYALYDLCVYSHIPQTSAMLRVAINRQVIFKVK